MTDGEFAEFCSEHPDLFFQMSGKGELIVMPPAFSWTSMQHSQILDSYAIGPCGINVAR